MLQILDLADCFATAHIRCAKCGEFRITIVGGDVLGAPHTRTHKNNYDTTKDGHTRRERGAEDVAPYGCKL